METELKKEEISPNLDELFRALGEAEFLYLKTKEYLNSLIEERALIIKLLEETHNGKNNNSEDLGTEE